MTPASCRKVQGAIGRDHAAPEVVAATARHLRACADCRAQDGARAKIRAGILAAPDTLDDLTRARVLARLLEGRRQQRAREGAAARRARAWLAWTLAFSSVMVAVAVLGVLRSRKPGGLSASPLAPVALEPYAVHGGATPGPQALSGGLDRVELPAHASMRARLGPAADFVLLGPLELAVRDGDGRRAALELRRGTLVGDFDGTKGRGLRIVTTDAIVDIVGTRFLVEASAQRTRVSVEHGRVRVESRGQVRLVGALEEWSTDSPEVQPLNAAGARLFERAARGDLEALGPEAASPPANTPPAIRPVPPGGQSPMAVAELASGAKKRPRSNAVSPPRTVAVRAGAIRLAEASAPSSPAGTASRAADTPEPRPGDGRAAVVAVAPSVAPPSVASPSVAAPVIAPPASSSVAPPSVASPAPADIAAAAPAAPGRVRPEPTSAETASSLYRRAEAALRQGDGSAGKKLLDQLVNTFPDRPETDSARYELAVMAQRAGQPDEALARTREILRPGAEGPFVEPARFLRCRVYLGRNSDEARASATDCLTRFVRDYPRSPHDEVALRALIDLARQAGRCDEARRFADAYLQRHPAGRFAGEAGRARSPCGR